MPQRSTGKPPPSISVALDVPGFRKIIRATMAHRQLNIVGLAAEAGLPFNPVQAFLADPKAGQRDRPPSSAVLFGLLAWLFPETVGALAVRRDVAADPDPVAAEAA